MKNVMHDGRTSHDYNKSMERWHSPLTVIIIAIVGGSDIPRFANA